LDGMELDGMDSFPLGVSFPLEGLELDFVIILFLFLIEEYSRGTWDLMK